MSLAKLKSKEGKGKQKSHLPKLKAILANPRKTKCPTLDEGEMAILENLFQTAVTSSETDVSKFATQHKICLGLESSLRCINNNQSSCVFISLNIKPIHIVSLIVRNAEVKDPVQPIFAQTNLEDFTEKIIGIRALCFVLPKDLQSISKDLSLWVEEQREKKKQTIEEKEKQSSSKIIKNKRKREKICKEQKEDVINTKEHTENEDSNENVKSWTGDFISFGKDDTEATTLENDPNIALNAFTQMMTRLPKNQQSQPIKDQLLPMEVDNAKDKVSEKKEIDSEDSIDFLDNYKELIVHKIKPNPNKKQKRKETKIKIKF